ncbi:hypothetical protein NLJ89_g2231 [Agrocybe chaxingu]|uniref:Uncharacterized protein n=1 Tax=Agrocybe chaxingu TaxID=84603 RepID=A0A9W8K698_9AGAR|nr:hypothetical protein NLJ89_g2231 [Agrocybe chaxingu]
MQNTSAHILTPPSSAKSSLFNLEGCEATKPKEPVVTPSTSSDSIKQDELPKTITLTQEQLQDIIANAVLKELQKHSLGTPNAVPASTANVKEDKTGTNDAPKTPATAPSEQSSTGTKPRATGNYSGNSHNVGSFNTLGGNELKGNLPDFSNNDNNSGAFNYSSEPMSKMGAFDFAKAFGFPGMNMFGGDGGSKGGKPAHKFRF